MGNLVSHCADEPDNRRAPTSTAELPTERDNDAAPELRARPNQERVTRLNEPACATVQSPVSARFASAGCLTNLQVWFPIDFLETF